MCSECSEVRDSLSCSARQVCIVWLCVFLFYTPTSWIRNSKYLFWGKKNYAAIVEHESEKTFIAMHLIDERQKAWEKVETLLDGELEQNFYEVVITSGKKK